MPWGTHFCHFYETKEDLLDILVPYFKTGLENNEFCLWVVCDPVDEEGAREALRRAAPAAERHVAAGDIEIVPHWQWYLRDGKFDLARVINGWKEKLAQALARGYAGLRVNGSMAWLTEKEWGHFQEYEKDLNKTLANEKILVLCTMPLAAAKPAEIFDVARAHEFSIVRRHGKWEVLETPELRQAKGKMAKLNEELEQRIEGQTRELAATIHDLKREIAERKEGEKSLRDSRERLRALAARLESLREEESIRIAREIHDELGQTLTRLKMDMLWMERKLGDLAGAPAINALLDRVVGATELVDSVTGAVQQIAADLRPIILDHLGLGAALREEARCFQERTGIPCEVRVPEMEAILAKERARALFRIFQESLTNAARHAQATKIEAALELEDGWVSLRVRDNGRGITEAEMAKPESLGLLGMKERTAFLGGTIAFERKPEGGTIVTVRIRQRERPAEANERA